MPNSPRMSWPYPAENVQSWYEKFKVLVEAMDSSAYAAREDRQLVLTGGGAITWDATGGTLTWGDTINIVSPITGFQIRVAASTATITDGQMLYVNLTRAPTNNVTALEAVAGQVPSTDVALILAVRLGSKLYWRNGLMVDSPSSLTDLGATQGGGGGFDPNAIHDNVAAEINAIAAKATPIAADEVIIEDSADGVPYSKKKVLAGNLGSAIKLDDLATPDDNTDLDSSLTEHGLLPKLGGGTTNFLRADGSWAAPSGSSGDIRTAAIVVGNSVAGDTSDNCDYLDVGDGVQLVAALAAASGKDVYIRPGTYDLGVGAAVAPLIVPTNVRVRGAGRSHTKITTKASANQGAFTLAADSILEDLGIDAALPTSSGSGATSVVLLNGARAMCRRVSVDFPGTWTGTQAGYTALRAVFEVGVAAVSSPADCLLDDCWVGQHNAAPALRSLGLGAGNEMACFAMRTFATPAWFSTQLAKCQSSGGDWAVAAQARVKLMMSMFYDMYLRGVVLSDDAGGSEVGDNHILPVGSAGTEIGILLDTVAQCGVHGNYIECTTPTAGQYAIALEAANYNTITANRGPGGLVGAVSLDAPSGNNIVTANQFSGASYSDLGALNDVVHNK